MRCGRREDRQGRREGAVVTALLDHPSADRRAIVAAEVRVMIRDLTACAVAAAIGGRVQARERAERARDEAQRLLDAGDVGGAHSVATAALDPRAVSP